MQEQDPVLKCTVHQTRLIQGICVNKYCNKLRPVCFECQKEFHLYHQNDLLAFDKFLVWRQGGVAVQDNIQIVIGKLELLAKDLREILQKAANETFNLESRTFEINDEVSNILRMKSLGAKLSDDLNNLGELLQIVREKSWKFKPQKDITHSQILEQQQDFINKIPFKFSEQNKLKEIKIQQQGDVVVGPKGYYGFCVCEPVIHNDGVTRVAFKIINLAWSIYLGVCQRGMIQSANYQPNLQNIKHGSLNLQYNSCYLINSDGWSYSHHEQKMNHKHQQFSIETNNIIIVEIENNMITWKNRSSNQTFTMPYKLGDLSYCVGIDQCIIFNEEYVVKIMNDI